MDKCKENHRSVVKVRAKNHYWRIGMTLLSNLLFQFLEELNPTIQHSLLNNGKVLTSLKMSIVEQWKWHNSSIFLSWKETRDFRQREEAKKPHKCLQYGEKSMRWGREGERNKAYTERDLRAMLLFQNRQMYEHCKKFYFMRNSRRLKCGLSHFMCHVMLRILYL